MTFFLRFLVFFALGLALLELPQYSQGFAPAARVALTTLSGWVAGYPEAAHGTRLQATPNTYYVEVVEGCLGTVAWLLFSAAVLAFSAPPRQRMNGLLLGLGLIALLNPLRIASIFRLGLWSPTVAEWAHRWWDMFTMFALITLFLLWARPGASGLAVVRRLTKTELRVWIQALAVLAISLGLWRMFGAACVAAMPPGLTKLLVNGLSWGYISDVSASPLHPERGWLFMLPAFAQAVDGVPQSLIPCIYIAYLLFPLISFALCQSLLGGSGRWQWQPWLIGLVFGVLWYGLGLAATAVHLQSVEAMHSSSQFLRHFQRTPSAPFAFPGLSTLFYVSGWLFKGFNILSSMAGFVLWAGQAARNRTAAEANTIG